MIRNSLLAGFLIAALFMTAPANGAEPRQRFDFETDVPGAVPRGFETGMTGKWRATEWTVRKIDGQNVLAHIGFWNEDPDDVFPLCWVRGSNARDLVLTVRLLPVRPPPEIADSVHDGAGMVVRLKDAENYYLLRAVPLEKRVRLYKVEKGKRTTLAGKDIEVPVGRWHELKLATRGNSFAAYLDGVELFSHIDESFREPGAFGLWSKPNNVTYFDDLIAEIVN